MVGQCPWWDPSRGRHSGTGGGPAGLVLRLLRGRAGGGRGRLRDGATAVPRSLRRPPPLRNRGLREQPLLAPAAPPAGRVHRPAGPRLTWDLPRESRPVGGPQRRARLRRPLSEDPAAALTPRGPGEPHEGPDEGDVTGSCGRVHGLGGEAARDGAQRGDASVAETGRQAWGPPMRAGGVASWSTCLGLPLREPQALRAAQPPTPVLMDVSPRLHGPTRTRDTRVGRGRAPR